MKPDAGINLKPKADGQSRMVVLVDTREQTPWAFPDEYVETRRATLNYGDYALEGDLFSVERKSLDDFVGTVSTGWERFCRELWRMPDALPRVVVVEGTFKRILNHEYSHPAVQPKLVVSRIAALTLAGVSVLLCDNHVMAAGMAYRMFRWRQAQLSAGK